MSGHYVIPVEKLHEFVRACYGTTFSRLPKPIENTLREMSVIPPDLMTLDVTYQATYTVDPDVAVALSFPGCEVYTSEPGDRITVLVERPEPEVTVRYARPGDDTCDNPRCGCNGPGERMVPT